MARGWESKSVESQLQDAAHRNKTKRDAAPPSEDERKRVGRQHCLELSRTRVMRELESCAASRFRVQLEHELAYLDAELHKLAH